MKKNLISISILTFLSALTGYLLSSISLVGRIGIGLFYHQYRFLKSWWKGALIVLCIWLLVFGILYLLRKKIKPSASNASMAISVVIALVGLYFTYNDFRHTLSHRWLGERFHLGVYLFWIVWIAISVKIWVMPARVEIGNNEGSASEQKSSASFNI